MLLDVSFHTHTPIHFLQDLIHLNHSRVASPLGLMSLIHYLMLDVRNIRHAYSIPKFKDTVNHFEFRIRVCYLFISNLFEFRILYLLKFDFYKIIGSATIIAHRPFLPRVTTCNSNFYISLSIPHCSINRAFNFLVAY